MRQGLGEGSNQLYSCCKAAVEDIGMKTEKRLHEGWKALWLAVAGVLVITLTWNVLMLGLKGISY